jgi:hypothetical protein
MEVAKEEAPVILVQEKVGRPVCLINPREPVR